MRESLLAGAGLGLFATGRWPAGSIICEYRGQARALGIPVPGGRILDSPFDAGPPFPQEHTLRQMLHLKDRTYLMVSRAPTEAQRRRSDRAGRLTTGAAHARAQALSLNLYIDSRLADGVAGPLSLGRYLNDHPDPSRINVRFEKVPRARGLPLSTPSRLGQERRTAPTRRPTVAQVPSRSKALCVTTRDVEAGEELYVSYGEARGALRHAGSVSVARKTRVVTAPCPACWPVPQKYWARLGGIPGGSSYRRGISADDAAPPHQ